MVESLLRGDVVDAWLANPLALVVAVVLGVRSLGWMVELVRSPGSPARRWMPAGVSRHWFVLSAVVAVVYVLARNLLPIA
jgi:hypothetical protein